jgi:hypothetical protein
MIARVVVRLVFTCSPTSEKPPGQSPAFMPDGSRGGRITSNSGLRWHICEPDARRSPFGRASTMRLEGHPAFSRGAR